MGRLKFCSVPISSPSLWCAWIGQNWRAVVSFLCRFHCQVWQSSKSRDVFSNMLLDKHLPGGTPFNNCEVRVAAYARVARGASSGSVISWSGEPRCARDEGSLSEASRVLWICSLCSGWPQGIQDPRHLLSCRAVLPFLHGEIWVETLEITNHIRNSWRRWCFYGCLLQTDTHISLRWLSWLSVVLKESSVASQCLRVSAFEDDFALG